MTADFELHSRQYDLAARNLERARQRGDRNAAHEAARCMLFHLRELWQAVCSPVASSFAANQAIPAE